jgi:cyanophycinase-like exopeptidase
MYKFFADSVLKFWVLCFLTGPVWTQTYTSFFVGNSSDLVVQPKGGVCLMGGASEHDNAMRWFLQQANGGDILILRTTGSNGYNDYMLNQLGVAVNSVETIVCNSPACAGEPYLKERIQKAEAVWFAGGDQWDYISYWRNTAVDSLINSGVKDRKMVIGGTSAGMAIQGGVYFSAQNGTITSQTALMNPFAPTMTVSSERFLTNKFLEDVITDTHYDNPDRRGRHVAFIARALSDLQQPVRGIACEEYTAVCIDTNGTCRIFGDYPTYDEDIYFIQPNCELSDYFPESCLASTPLTWNRGGLAMNVYHAKGTQNGDQTFDLSTWNTGSGGVWENWYVIDGQLFTMTGTVPGCSLGLDENDYSNRFLYPNPAVKELFLGVWVDEVRIIDELGRLCLSQNETATIDISNLKNGSYLVSIHHSNTTQIQQLLIHH